MTTPARGRFVAAVVALCVAAAVATVLVARLAFPDGSGDLDETAYAAQADALRHGELTLPAATHDPFFRPFLTGVRDDRVVFKYQPVWPAVIAASDALTGSDLPARVLLSVAGVLAVMWFTWELVRRHAAVLIAGLVIAASPFAWVQSASLLGYQLSFVLTAAGGAALLAATREPGARFALLGGALFGVAAFHRPFDALVTIGPVIVFALVRLWRARRAGRAAVWFGLGGLPFAALFLAYNRAVMGSPLRMAYGVTGTHDRFGFGWRASFDLPGGGRSGQIHYTVGTAFSTLGDFFLILPRFVAFAPAVVVCVVVLFRARGRDPRVWLLVSMFVANVVGYFFWWGNANTLHFDLQYSLGPFYGYALLVPLAAATGWGATEIRTETLRLVAVIAGVMWAGWSSVVVVRDAAADGDGRTYALGPFRGTEQRLVLEPRPFPGDPYLHVVNDTRLGGDLVVAADLPLRRLEVIDRFPDRTPYVVRSTYVSDSETDSPLLERVPATVERGDPLQIRVVGAPEPGFTATPYLQVGAGPERRDAPGSPDATLALGAPDLPASGAVTVAAGIEYTRETPTGTERWRRECRFEARRSANGEAEALPVCDSFEITFLGGSAFEASLDSPEDLVVTITGSPA